MAKKSKRTKKKRRSGGSRGGGGGQTMSGFRGGFKGLVGQGGPKKKESTLSKVITYLLLAAAVAFLVYRFTR